MFGKSIAIRQAVAVNSEGIRAMHVVLADPKFTLNKVFVLVGGPDWPVSVLCGILNLNILPIMVGTIPVIILVLPCVFAGSFAYMGSMEDENGVDTYPWAGRSISLKDTYALSFKVSYASTTPLFADTMAAVSSACVAGVMGIFTLSAANAVKETFEKNKDKIDAIPLDEEVKMADEVAERKANAYSKAVVWSNVPFCAKVSLILSVITMILCVFMLALFTAQCFEDYDLMYTIDEHLGGKWHNLVKPMGRYALLLMLISYLFLYAFQSWAAVRDDNVFNIPTRTCYCE